MPIQAVLLDARCLFKESIRNNTSSTSKGSLIIEETADLELVNNSMDEKLQELLDSGIQIYLVYDSEEFPHYVEYEPVIEAMGVDFSEIIKLSEIRNTRNNPSLKKIEYYSLFLSEHGYNSNQTAVIDSVYENIRSLLTSQWGSNNRNLFTVQNPAGMDSLTTCLEELINKVSGKLVDEHNNFPVPLQNMSSMQSVYDDGLITLEQALGQLNIIIGKQVIPEQKYREITALCNRLDSVGAVSNFFDEVFRYSRESLGITTHWLMGWKYTDIWLNAWKEIRTTALAKLDKEYQSMKPTSINIDELEAVTATIDYLQGWVEKPVFAEIRSNNVISFWTRAIAGYGLGYLTSSSVEIYDRICKLEAKKEEITNKAEEEQGLLGRSSFCSLGGYESD